MHVPGKKSKEIISDGGTSDALPDKEAMEFIRKMGIETDGLEAEVKDVWRMLNDMSAKDPLEYQKFVEAQMSSYRVGRWLL